MDTNLPKQVPGAHDDGSLARYLGPIDLLQTPVWILGADAQAVLWQNRASTAMTTRPGESGPGALNRRLVGKLTDISAGARELPVRFALTAHPALTICSANWLDTPLGRHIIVEGSPDRRTDADTRRGVEALRYTSVMISEYALADLTLLTANPAAMEAFEGAGADLGALFVDEGILRQALEIIDRNGQHHFQCRMHTRNGPRWHALEMRLTLDPVHHAPMLLLTQTDITGRKEMEALKDRFIATISHELRTPLTSIRGALGLLNAGDRQNLPPRWNTLLDLATRNTQRLMRMVENLLAFRQFELGTLDVMLRPEALVPLLTEAVLNREEYAAGFQVRFGLAVHARDDLQVLADRERLIQAIDQLLTNAAKFTVAGDTVEVRLQQDRDSATIRVQDHGPGIAAAYRPRLFARFSQADSTNARAHDGLGLGLALARNIVERHGGHIDIDPKVTSGACFRITLPALEHGGGGHRGDGG